MSGIIANPDAFAVVEPFGKLYARLDGHLLTNSMICGDWCRMRRLMFVLYILYVHVSAAPPARPCSALSAARSLMQQAIPSAIMSAILYTMLSLVAESSEKLNIDFSAIMPSTDMSPTLPSRLFAPLPGRTPRFESFIF